MLKPPASLRSGSRASGTCSRCHARAYCWSKEGHSLLAEGSSADATQPAAQAEHRFSSSEARSHGFASGTVSKPTGCNTDAAVAICSEARLGGPAESRQRPYARGRRGNGSRLHSARCAAPTAKMARWTAARWRTHCPARRRLAPPPYPAAPRACPRYAPAILPASVWQRLPPGGAAGGLCAGRKWSPCRPPPCLSRPTPACGLTWSAVPTSGTK